MNVSTLNRRALLGALAAAPAVALPAAAAPPPHPVERLQAVHDEASELMAVYNQYVGGRWELRIQAQDSDGPAVLYHNLAARRPSGPDIASYDACFTAADRLQHHLLMASLAADEIAAGADRRWRVWMQGKAGTWAPSFRLDAIDLVADPEPSRRCGQPARAERETALVHWTSGRRVKP